MSVRELQTFVFRSRGWFISAVFLAISGAYFSYALETNGSVYLMRSVFAHLEMLSIFVVPLLSMGAIAGEKQGGTLQMLMNVPVREEMIILAKFTGILAFYCLLLVPTLLFPWTLSLRAVIDPGPVISGYVGLLLSGTLFLSLGIFISSCAPNVIFSGILTLFILAFFRMMPQFSGTIQVRSVREIISFLNFQKHLHGFWVGQIHSGSIVYFLVTSLFLLFASSVVLKGKRVFAI